VAQSVIVYLTKNGKISKDIHDCFCLLRTKQTSETSTSVGKESHLKMIQGLGIIMEFLPANL
jgi:hypothetical protein